MNCDDCRGQLLEWLHGLLEGPEANAVASHVESCAGCGKLLEGEKARQVRWKVAVRENYPELSFQPPAKTISTGSALKVYRSLPRSLVYALAASALVAIGLGTAITVAETRVSLADAVVASTRQAMESSRGRETLALNNLNQQRDKGEQERREILSRGAVPPVNVVINGPAAVVAGAPATYRIEALGPDGRPRPAKLATRLQQAGAGGSFVSLTPRRMPDGAHELVLPADVRLDGRTQPVLEITADVVDPQTNKNISVVESVPLGLPPLITHLVTDRRLYLPGETVRFRSLTLERATLRPSRDHLGLSFRLIRPDGSVTDLGQGDGRIRRTENGALANGPEGQPIVGLGAGEIALEADAPGGEYTLRVEDSARRFAPRDRKFLVQEYQPQRLSKELVFGKRSYGPGDAVEATLKGSTATGEPLAGARVEVTLRVDDIQVDASGKESGAIIPVTLDGTGKGVVSVTLPREIRKGDVSLTAVFSDGANRETLVKPVPVVLRNLAIEFFPEGGDLVAGATGRVYFSARTPLGKPAEIRGKLLEDGKALPGEFVTFSDQQHPGTAQGFGVIEFQPVAGKSYELELLSPEAGSRHPLPRLSATGTGLRAESGMRHGDAVAAIISPAKPARHLLGLYCRGRLLDSKVLEPGVVRADLKPGDDPGGVGRVTVFRMDQGKDQPELVPAAERLVWLPARNNLTVEMSVAQAGNGAGPLAPGDRARLSISAKDASGKYRPALALLSVVDRSNVVLADEKSARSMPTHFLIGEEVRHAVDLEYADFLSADHPQARRAIDLLLGVQGWRRFAEQDPAKFQRQFPVESQNYLISTGQKDHRAVSTAGIALERALRKHDERQEDALKPVTTAAEAARSELAQAGHAYQESLQGLDKAFQLKRQIGFWTRLAIVGGGALSVLYGLTMALSLVPMVLGRIAIGGLVLAGLVAWIGSNAQDGLGWSSRLVEFVRDGAPASRFPNKSAMADAAFPPAAPAAERLVKNAPAAPEAAVMMGAVMDRGPGAPRALPRAAAMKMDNPGLRIPAPANNPAARNRGDDFRPAVPRQGNRALAAAPVPGGMPVRKNIAAGLRRPGLPGGPIAGQLAARDEMADFDPVRVVDRPMLVREYSHSRVRGSEGARTDFSETLLWQPAAMLADGTASVEFDLCDSVTRFQAVAMIHTDDGEIAQGMVTFESRLPLSLSLKTPFEVTASDIVKAVASVEGRPGIGSVRLDPSALTGAVLEGPGAEELPLSGNGRARRILTLRPGLLDQEIGYGIQIAGGGFTDSIKGKVRVVPEGFPVEGALSDRVAGALDRTLRLPKEWVSGSLRLDIEAYPSTIGELAKGLDGMLREPHGCFEQTSSSNYPNTMILGFLKETGRSNPEVEASARDMLAKGYSRLVGFECMDSKAGKKHGFEWFGAPDQQHEALTAYGLMQFADMQSVGVEGMDKDLVARTRSFLMGRRDGQGGFQRNPRNLDRFGAAPTPTTNAYITWALSETGPCDELKKEIDAVRDAASGSPDMYLKGLAVCCLVNAGRTDEAGPLAKALVEAQNGEGMIAGGQATVTRSMGQSLDIETTALAAIALMKLPNQGPNAVASRKAADWLGKQRDGFGSYGATQSTVLALKALIGQARLSKGEIKAGEVRLLVGEKTFAKAFPAGATEMVSLPIPDAERVFKPGDNKVRFEITGGSEMPASLTWRYHTLVPPSSPKALVDIRTKLDRDTLAEGESTRLKVTVDNKSDAGQGMVIAVVGLPAGLNIPTDGKQLIDLCRVPTDGTRPRLAQWEVRGRELVLYWRDLAPRETVELSLDVEARVPGIYRGPASRAYLYYTPEHRTWIEPIRVTITPAS